MGIFLAFLAFRDLRGLARFLETPWSFQGPHPRQSFGFEVPPAQKAAARAVRVPIIKAVRENWSFGVAGFLGGRGGVFLALGPAGCHFPRRRAFFGGGNSCDNEQ